MVFEPNFDWTGQLHGHRLAETVATFAGGYTNPAFRNTILLDIITFALFKADPNAPLQYVHIKMGTARIS